MSTNPPKGGTGSSGSVLRMSQMHPNLQKQQQKQGTAAKQPSSRSGGLNPSSTKQHLSVLASVNQEVPFAKSNLMNEWMTCFRRQGGDSADGDIDIKPPNISTLELLKFATPYERCLMIIGLIMATFSGLGMPAWLILLAMALDTFTSLSFWSQQESGEQAQEAMIDQLFQLTVAFFVVGVVALVSGASYIALWTYTGEKQSLRIKELYVKSIFKQDAQWYDAFGDRGKIPTMIETSMLHINDAIGRQMVDCFAFLISAIGCLCVAMFLNVVLALIMLAVVGIAFVIVTIFGVYIRRASKIAAEHANQAGGLATEVISGMKTVTALCAQRWALKRYQGHSETSQIQWTRSGILGAIMAAVTGLMFYLTYMLAFSVGTFQVANNSAMTTIVFCMLQGSNIGTNLPGYVGQVVDVVQTFTGETQPPIQEPNCKINGASVMVCIYGVIICITYVGLMSPAMRAMNLGRQAAVDVFQTIRHIPAIDSSSNEGRKLSSVKGKIELENVTFTYPSASKPIFYNLNLVIEPGQSVALVGPSGSGKSTITKMLLRFYDASDGMVLIDGVPIEELNIQWWRSQIGYVQQDPILFPGTVSANIAAGKPGATQDEIIEAAKAASAHEFIMDLPDGYETFYSGASMQMSGGQIQRINLARALIRKPAILLLDEATSALDNASERQVQDALENIRKVQQVTTVSVSHRLSTIVDCDLIAVIADGKIAEKGTHKALVEEGGIYATLCSTQGIGADYKVDHSQTAEAPLDNTKNGQAADVDVALGGKNDLEKPKDGEEKAEEPQEVPMAELSTLKRHYKADNGRWLMGIIGSGIIGALSPCESILAAQIIANFYRVEPEDMLQANMKYILSFLAFAGAAVIGHLMYGYGFSISVYSMAKELRVNSFEAILRHPMGWFDVPEHSAGELSTLLSADVDMLADQSGWQYGYKVRMVSSLVAGVVVALVYSWPIGLTVLACVPLIFGAAIIQALCMKRQFVQDTGGLPPATILEQGVRTISAVQAYNLQQEFGEDYSISLQPESKAKVKRGFVAGVVYGLSQFSVFATFAIVFLVGTILVTNGQIGFIGFFTSFAAIMFGSLGAAQVGAEFTSLQEAKAAAARLISVLEQPTHNTDPFEEKGLKPALMNGNITFENCFFHYPTRPDKQIFYKSAQGDGFCLDISAKETVAFVGKSGCGKSTAQQILLRFYEPCGGSVKIDGTPIENLNIEWVRRQIGYVGQMPILFSGTIRENLLLGCPGATEEQIIAATKAANAHDFVMGFSSGYDTDVGVGGSKLSGGQRQRICISRAILSSPKILVLDEATSALDNESQKLVEAALDSLQKTQPRTTLTVAHRLTTIQHSDKIVVLGEGSIKQAGTHESLIEEGGLYSQLWKMQGISEDTSK